MSVAEEYNHDEQTDDQDQSEAERRWNRGYSREQAANRQKKKKGFEKLIENNVIATWKKWLFFQVIRENNILLGR